MTISKQEAHDMGQKDASRGESRTQPYGIISQTLAGPTLRAEQDAANEAYDKGYDNVSKK